MFLTATLNLVLLLAVGIISANKCSQTRYDTIIRGESSLHDYSFQLKLDIFHQQISFLGGPSLPVDEIVSRHNVTSSDVMLGCHSHCEGETKCVGFNYRTTKNVENCQLINVTKKKEETKTGEWILMQKVEAVI